MNWQQLLSGPAASCENPNDMVPSGLPSAVRFFASRRQYTLLEEYILPVAGAALAPHAFREVLCARCLRSGAAGPSPQAPDPLAGHGICHCSGNGISFRCIHSPMSFLEGTMYETSLRAAMTEFGASLFNRGYSSGSSGNMSVRLPNGSILATPTNSSLGRLVPERLSLVGMDGTLLSGDKPSKECAFHRAIYKARPECNAIVHLHSTYVTALSCLKGLDPEDVLRPFTPYYVMKVSPLPLVPYFKPGSQKLFEAIGLQAEKSASMLLANHGAITTGASLEQAVNAAEELEETAKLFFLLRGSDIRYLTEAEIQELKG